jgi:SIR2-like protein/TIR domain-containing protein
MLTLPASCTILLLKGGGMRESSGTPGRSGDQRADAVPARLQVFINYRHDDAWGTAELLYDRLANAFGSENIFLDTRNLQPGMNWLQEIKAHRDSSGVLLALIGPNWMSIMKARQQQAREQAAVGEPEQDYVRFELEYALKGSSGIHVIPVLLGDDVPFTAQGLPRSLQPVTRIEVEQVRQKRFEDDVAHLIDRLKTIAKLRTMIRERSTEVPVRVPQSPRVEEHTRHRATSTAVAPAPGTSHCATILEHMAEGNLVPFLGSSLVVGHPGPPGGPPSVFDASELATDLAERFGMKSARPELPEVAQYVYVTRGEPDLYQALRKILTTEYEPGPVHRFLASLPQKLEERRFENRYQLIVSTNFDRALEQAFDDEREPYDLAVYMASGPDKGKFVHFPYDGDPVPILQPNRYGGFPIADYGELDRTVIVKIHGAVDGSVSGYRWRENYVVTEDHYIDYLSSSPIENLVPVQILEKLSYSHCLFLGYPVRDWNLRVFLKRAWKGEPIRAKSWAIEPSPDALEKEFWAQSHVDVYEADLADYIDQLDQRLAGQKAASAEL